MTRLRASLAVVASCAFAVGGAVQAGAKTYTVDIAVTMTRDGQTQSGTVKAYVKSATVYRFEETQGARRVVTIASGVDAWRYDPVHKTGQHMKAPAQLVAQMAKAGGPIGNELKGYIARGAKKVGQASIGADRCDIYRMGGAGRPTITLWVLQGPDKLTRRSSTMLTINAPSSPGGPPQKHTLAETRDYTNWQINKPLPDSLFRVPAGVKITEVAMPVPGGRVGGK